MQQLNRRKVARAQQLDRDNACGNAQPSPKQLHKQKQRPHKQQPHSGRKQDNSGGKSASSLALPQSSTRGGKYISSGPQSNYCALRRRRQKRAVQLATGQTNSPKVCVTVADHVQHDDGQFTHSCDSHSDEPVSACSHCLPDCAKLTEDLKAGGEARQSAVANLKECIRALAFHKEGCRVLQLALQVTDWRVMAELLPELRGHVRDAIRSPHANFVIQKIIELMPTAQAAFIAEELSGTALEVACHRYGCRILSRLVEHSASGTKTFELLNELIPDAGLLCKRSFGHYVIQSILEHGTMDQRRQVMDVLCSNPLDYVQNRNGCYVIEAAISYCPSADQERFIDVLLGEGANEFTALAQSQCGSYVVRALLRLPNTSANKVHKRLQEVLQDLEVTKFGRRVLEDLRISLAKKSLDLAA